MRLFWDIAMCVFAVEIALRYRQMETRSKGGDKRLMASFAKLTAYRGALRTCGLAEPTVAARIATRFERLSTLEQTEFRLANESEILLALRPESSEATPTFKPSEALKFAYREMNRLHGEILTAIDVAEPVLAQYGRTLDRVDYSHMLYYDIIDSTATHAARRRKNVEEHRKRVNSLKGVLNRWFDRAIGQSHETGDTITCVNGTKASSNDCKHVFIRGVNAKKWLSRVISGIVHSSDTMGMFVRIYAVPCTFAGTGAYRQGADPEIQGKRFWEHWSRVSKACSRLEPQQPVTASFLLLATDEMIETLVLDDSVEWSDRKDEVVKSEIEYLQRETPVRFGSLRAVPARQPVQ